MHRVPGHACNLAGNSAGYILSSTNQPTYLPTTNQPTSLALAYVYALVLWCPHPKTLTVCSACASVNQVTPPTHTHAPRPGPPPPPPQTLRCPQRMQL